jgi:hypothetical protein
MSTELNLTQDLVQASKKFIEFAYHNNLSENDCEAVFFCALELITAIEQTHCKEEHVHTTLEKGLPYMVPESQLLWIEPDKSARTERRKEDIKG